MIIDLSQPIEHSMPVYPGDAPTILVQSKKISEDGYNNHQLSTNMHAGTHIDGPMHLLDNNAYINECPIDQFVGDACLINAEGHAIVDYKEEYEQLVQEEQIVVIYTGHSKLYGQPAYFTEYPIVTADFAELMIRKHVKMVCLDTPSPDYDPFDVHVALFKHNILIAENLTNVHKLLGVGAFEIIALPLPIRADSSVARVIARVK